MRKAARKARSERLATPQAKLISDYNSELCNVSAALTSFAVLSPCHCSSDLWLPPYHDELCVRYDEHDIPDGHSQNHHREVLNPSSQKDECQPLGQKMTEPQTRTSIRSPTGKATP